MVIYIFSQGITSKELIFGARIVATGMTILTVSRQFIRGKPIITYLKDIILFGLLLIIVLSLIYNKLMQQNTYGANAKSKFLCDSCAYDYERACHNRERPNAKSCKNTGAGYKRVLLYYPLPLF